MRLLLDTHTLIWVLLGSDRLGRAARHAIEEADPLVSAVNVWEIAIKHRIGRFAMPPPTGSELVEKGFDTLPVWVEHAIEVAELPLHHADPFDRMLIAQARVESLTVLTVDPLIGSYDVPILDAAT